MLQPIVSIIIEAGGASVLSGSAHRDSTAGLEQFILVQEGYGTILFIVE